jgi:hypothetical protein
VTARASTPEYVCSSCSEAARRVFEPAELAVLPSCSACGRLICEECELLSYCPPCARVLWMPPLELEDEERPGSLAPAAACGGDVVHGGPR